MQKPTDDDRLEFQPVHSGLGFHPFSDGLPYTPGPAQVSPPQTPAPAQPAPAGGAVSAGRPRFAFPPKPASNQRVIAPVVAKSPVRQTHTPPPTASHVVLTPNLPVKISRALYLAKRAAAAITDIAVGLVVGTVGVYLVLKVVHVPPSILFEGEALVVFLGFLGIFTWSLTAAQEVAFLSTIGKQLLGLRLEGDPLRVLIRAILFPVSLACLGMGLVPLLFGKNSLHDYLTGTNVREIAAI